MIFTKMKIFNFMLFYKVNFVSKNGRSKSIWIDFCDRSFLNKVDFDLMASFLFWKINFFQFRLRIAMPRGHFSDFGDSAGTPCWQFWKNLHVVHLMADANWHFRDFDPPNVSNTNQSFRRDSSFLHIFYDLFLQNLICAIQYSLNVSNFFTFGSD